MGEYVKAPEHEFTLEFIDIVVQLSRKHTGPVIDRLVDRATEILNG